MTDKKYKIRKDLSIEFEGHILYRIEALRNIDTCFGEVVKGDIGGYIENRNNLSSDHDCWIFHDAKVFDKAKVIEYAVIINNAIVKDYALIRNESMVGGNTIVSDYAIIHDNARIINDAKVCDHALIEDTATIRDYAIIKNSSIIKNNVIIAGTAIVESMISDNRIIAGNAVISYDIRIKNSNDILVIGPIGSRNAYTTFVRQPDNIYVQCGCFFGNIDQFKAKVTSRYNSRFGSIDKNYSVYMNAIEYVKKHFEIIQIRKRSE